MTLEAGQARILKRAEMILQAARNRVENESDWRVRSPIEDMRIVVGYAEPGYGCTDSIIAFGDWNTVTAYKDGEHETLSTLPEKLGEMLEKAGVECEWSDEWTECGECGKAVRTQGDSYCWTPSYVMGDGELSCEDCILEDPSSYLEGLEGDENTAITLSVDPEQHGYTHLPERYEAGFHPGQDASPALIAEALRAAGIERFIFRIDAQGQFDTRFSVYVANEELAELARDTQQEHYETCNDADFCGHDAPDADSVEEDDAAANIGADLLAEQLAGSKTDGPSPSEGLKRALQSIPVGPAPDGGILYSKVDAASGTAETHIVTPEQFLKGDLP